MPAAGWSVEWASQNNRLIQMEFQRLDTVEQRLAVVETGIIPILNAGTVGLALLALTTPGAIRFIRINADGSVTMRAAADYRGDLGLGTMSTQDANNVAITGGTINGTSIGATTPSTGAFTALSTTSTATIGGNTSITGTLTTTGLSSGPTKRVSSQFEVGDGTGDSARFLNVSNSSRSARISIDPANSGANTQFDIYVDNVERAKFLAATSTWSLTGNTSITGTVSASNLSGTTYTPTLGGTVSVNVASSTLQTARYTRVGNVVDVTAVFFLTPTAGSTSTRISVTLPVASNFSTVYQCAGGCFHRETAFLSGGVFGDSTNDNAVVEFTSQSTSLHEVVAKFSYQVI